MKRILATILTLVILLSVAPSVGTVADAAGTPDKPFVAMNWGPVEEGKFDNVTKAYVIEVKNIGGQIKLGNGDSAALAKSVKTALDKLPDDMKYIRLFKPGEALKIADLVIYADDGVKQLKKEFEAFIKAYHDLGGKLAGIILDVEYTAMGSWYLYLNTYGGHNKPSEDKIKANGYNRNIYHDIVAHPKYKELRAMLVEYGFKFYENIKGDRSEIWSMYPPQTIKQVLKGKELTEHTSKYTGCYEIWNKVMYNRQAMYFNYALYEPLKALYPNATMSDYQCGDGATWYKNVTNYANDIKTGNVSNSNDYSGLPNAKYFKDEGVYLYQNPASYNNAVYDDDPYGMLLWNINKFKNIYESTDTKKISVWIAEYDYSSRAGSYFGNTAYYTESLYHYGMLDPQPFLIYFADTDNQWRDSADNFLADKYYNRLGIISEILKELSLVAGYSDRKPISVPVNWNDGYVLTGMYAGGRNVWRITPDTTSGTSKEAFKIKDSDPTFKINGTTITFPGGKILREGAVSTGSTGYWVETAKNVSPVVTRDVDRYSKYPSYMENYESYAVGTALTASNVALPQTWEIKADQNLVITAQDGGKALALTGNATLTNVKLPKNITAADTFADHQAWEISVTLPAAMNSGSKVVLLNSEPDGGFMLEGGKVYYDDYGEYKELAGVTLTTGQKYTFKRDMNFDGGVCTYSVYAGGELLKQVADVDMKEVTTPITKINISCTGLTTQVLIDDYKLYPNGIALNLGVYDYYGGEKLHELNKLNKVQLGYRLSWMNATATKQTVKLIAACYDSSNSLVSETVLATVDMMPGADGVVTGNVQNKGTQIQIYVDDGHGGALVKPDDTPADGAESDSEDTTKATKATKATKPTKAPLTKPTRASKATRPASTKTTAATKNTAATKATAPVVKAEVQEGGIKEVNDSLKKAGLDTVEKVKDALVEVLQKANDKIANENIAHYDISVDKDDIPKDGKMTIILPYPAGTDATYNFYVAHMFTTDAYGKKPGEIEMPEVTNVKEGIRFEVTGLSPIAVGWTAPEPEATEVPSEATDPADGSKDSAKGNMLIIIIAIVVAVLAAAGGVSWALIKKKKPAEATETPETAEETEEPEEIEELNDDPEA